MPDALADIPTEDLGEIRPPRGVSRDPALTIISHPAMARAGERLVLEALATGGEVAVSRMSPDFRRRGQPSGAPLGDPFVSRKPFAIAPGASGGVRIRVEPDGTPVTVDGQPVRGELELGPRALAAGVPVVLSQRVVLLLHQVEREGDGPPEDQLGMLGESDRLRRVREQIRNVVDLNVPVLVRGGTGTGKEHVARALHERSRRKGKFVPVNLGAISKDLAASELFGVRRGAFTGADRDRDGLFREAEGGTLFLDEVGEAPELVQVMLLRVLESRELYPVGSQTPVEVDVRLVAATDANLEERMQSGQFKEPLFYRLQEYVIRLPLLRERREDVGLLFTHFAREQLETMGEAWRLLPPDPRAEPWLPVDVALALLRFSWPGNVRQLRNVTRQLIIGSRGRPVLAPDEELTRQLGLNLTPPPNPPTSHENTPAPKKRPADYTREELLEALRACDWEIAAAAERLGLVRGTLQNLMRKHDIPTAADLTPDQIGRCHQECGGKLDEMVKRLEVSRLALRARVRALGLELHES